MNDQINRVEVQRGRLEDNINRLRASFHHWRTWEAEYDALREEVNALPEDASADDMRQLSTDFASDVIKLADIEELIGTKLFMQRSRGQIAALISRRIDWVQQNCKSAAKQLRSAEAQVGDSQEDVPISTPQTVPSADIVEQLDDEDHVLSGTVAQPGERVEVVSMLQRAGVTDDAAASIQPAPPSKSPLLAGASPTSRKDEGPAKDRKKSVTFSSDTKTAPSSSETPATSDSVAQPPLKSIINGSFKPKDKVYQIGDDDRPIDFHSPNIPADESPEDAALRRQMLEYNMQEVGAVVAEMDLDDEGTEDGFTSDDDEIELDSTTDEDEDEYGRSTRKGVSDDYREQMLRLEKQLNAQMMRNVGRANRGDVNGDTSMDVDSVEPSNGNAPSSKTNDAGAKSVRFATNLDIAPSTSQEPTTIPKAPEQPSQPVASAVVERSGAPRDSEVTAPKPVKVSRFKQAQQSRAASAATEANATLSSTVVERPPKDPTGNGQPGKKVSRFKAARAGNAGG